MPPMELGAARARARRILVRVTAVALATVVCLVVLEVGLRLAGYQPLFDTYSKPELFWRYDPVLGWAHQPDQSGTYVGPKPFPIEFRAKVRLNSLGLRGPELTDVPPGGFRVLFLGDSIVAGFEVDDDKTFAALLGSKLTAELGAPVQTANAGVRGYGTDQEYLYYRDAGRRLRPDLVVLQATYNDLEDNTTLHRARRPFGKAAFSLQEGGDLKLVSSPVPEYPFCSGVVLNEAFEPVRIDTARSRAMCWFQTSLADHSALFTFAVMRIQQNPVLVHKLFDLGTPEGQGAGVAGAVPGHAQTAATRLTTALIREMGRAVLADGARFLVAIRRLEWSRLDVPALERDGIATFDLSTVEEEGSVDAGDGTRYDPTLHFKADSHYNERGHARVAELIAPVLARELRQVAQARMHASQDPRPPIEP
jgi:lysophospholipase L1-like esterase